MPNKAGEDYCEIGKNNHFAGGFAFFH